MSDTLCGLDEAVNRRIQTAARYGAWVCDRCGSVERTEHEVRCSLCKQGLMNFIENLKESEFYRNAVARLNGD